MVVAVLAFGANAYNVADTLDGLYARYSGRASRLGELFDHGLDPVSLGSALLTFGIVMREPDWLILASATPSTASARRPPRRAVSRRVRGPAWPRRI